MDDVYRNLAAHLEKLIMGYPYHDALIGMLEEMFTPLEAKVALAIPNDLLPLEVADLATIAQGCGEPESAVLEALESLAQRNLIYSAPGGSGQPGYALLQVGYGMPQTLFWSGDRSDYTKKMATHVMKYFSVPTTQTVYGGTPTKTFKYIPAGIAVDIPQQGVMPHEYITPIVEAATTIAVAHCPCRMTASILGRTDCHHSLEVCLKYDELAEFTISKGLARRLSSDEALSILDKSEKEGLVHMVDNAQGEIKHTCNCCGHYCWNVGIIRRRKIPRDVLMAVYFSRVTEMEACAGCGQCADICPVDAVRMTDDGAQVDQDWCIGCGVCAVACPTGAISLRRRTPETGPENFAALHNQIRTERKLP